MLKCEDTHGCDVLDVRSEKREVPHLLHTQKQCVVVFACLTAHTNGSFDFEVQFFIVHKLV